MKALAAKNLSKRVGGSFQRILEIGNRPEIGGEKSQQVDIQAHKLMMRETDYQSANESARLNTMESDCCGGPRDHNASATHTTIGADGTKTVEHARALLHGDTSFSAVERTDVGPVSHAVSRSEVSLLGKAVSLRGLTKTTAVHDASGNVVSNKIQRNLKWVSVGPVPVFPVGRNVERDVALDLAK
jgi:hypothetical protein